MNPALQQACVLMKNGVPFHVAFGMSHEESSGIRFDAVERTAFTIIFGILEGAEFNWRKMCFEERKE
jgi:hypothetical protein